MAVQAFRKCLANIFLFTLSYLISSVEAKAGSQFCSIFENHPRGVFATYDRDEIIKIVQDLADPEKKVDAAQALLAFERSFPAGQSLSIELGGTGVYFYLRIFHRKDGSWDLSVLRRLNVENENHSHFTDGGKIIPFLQKELRTMYQQLIVEAFPELEPILYSETYRVAPGIATDPNSINLLLAHAGKKFDFTSGMIMRDHRFSEETRSSAQRLDSAVRFLHKNNLVFYSEAISRYLGLGERALVIKKSGLNESLTPESLGGIIYTVEDDILLQLYDQLVLSGFR